MTTILSDRNVLVVGLMQTCAESAMYIFVFLWTPVLHSSSSPLPLGLVFSTFMVCLMLGSQVTSCLYQQGSFSHLVIVRSGLLVMGVSLSLASLSISVSVSFFSFLVFELAIGDSKHENENISIFQCYNIIQGYNIIQYNITILQYHNITIF